MTLTTSPPPTALPTALPTAARVVAQRSHARIAGVKALDPVYRYRQEEIAQSICDHQTAVSARTVRAIFEGAEVTERAFAVPLEDLLTLTPVEANARQRQHAAGEGSRAALAALRDAAVDPEEVGLVVTTTYTGVGVPAWDLDLMRRIGLPATVARMSLHGMGCSSGPAMVARAADYLAANPDRAALLVAAEPASLTLPQNSGAWDVHRTVEAALFGDDATAVVMTGGKRPHAPGAGAPGALRVMASATWQQDATGHLVGWQPAQTGLHTTLDRALPAHVAQALPDAVAALLDPVGLTADDVSAWVCHPGSGKILSSIATVLDISPSRMADSRMAFHRMGNTLGASVLRGLGTCLQHPPEDGSWIVMLAVGPGLVYETALLRWETS